MKSRRGQMTLEFAVMLMVVISIFAYVTIPASEVSRATISGVGTSALARKAVDSIVQKANVVGISGEGARGAVKITPASTFKLFSITGGRNLSASFEIPSSAELYDLEGTELYALVTPSISEYTREADFDISGDLSSLAPLSSAQTYCVCMENSGGVVELETMKYGPWGCDCTDVYGIAKN